MCAAVGAWYADELMPRVAGIVAAIDAATSAREDQFRVGRVHMDRKNIGVVDEPVMDGAPACAAIYGFPGEVRSAGIDNVRIGGMEGQRRDIPHFRIVLARDPLPILSAVGAEENALRRASRK